MPPSDLALPPGLRDPSRRKLFNVKIKDEVEVLKYAHETNGEYTEVRVRVAPGGGTPLHYHGSYSEHFAPVIGELGIVLGNDTITCSPGNTAVVPVGTKHRFFNPSATEDIEFIGKVVPAHEGFEKTIYIMYGLANDGECDDEGVPTSFVVMCLVGDMGDLKIPGPMKWFGGGLLVKCVAAYARWSGLEERLINKYWR